MNIADYKIETEVNEMYSHLITNEVFDEQVREKIAYIIARTANENPKSIMFWVAEQTKSVVRGNSETKQFKFSFVGC